MVQIRFHLELFLPERIDLPALNGKYRKRSDYVNGMLAFEETRKTDLFKIGGLEAFDRFYDGGL